MSLRTHWFCTHFTLYPFPLQYGSLPFIAVRPPQCSKITSQYMIHCYEHNYFSYLFFCTVMFLFVLLFNFISINQCQTKARDDFFLLKGTIITINTVYSASMFIIITHYTTGTDSSPQRVSRSQLQGFRSSCGSCRVGSLCYWLPVPYILGMLYTWMFPRCGTIVSLNKNFFASVEGGLL